MNPVLIYMENAASEQAENGTGGVAAPCMSSAQVGFSVANCTSVDQRHLHPSLLPPQPLH